MSTVGILIWPEQGHLNGSAKLAREIIARGHEVYFTTLSDFEQPVRDQGFEFVPLLEETFPRGQFSRLKVAKTSIEQSSGLSRLRAFKTALSLWRATNARFKISLAHLRDGKTKLPNAGRNPDLLIVDSMLPFFALIARREGIPVLLHSTHLPAEEDPLSPPPMSQIIPHHTRHWKFKTALTWNCMLFSIASLRKLFSPFGVTFDIHQITKDIAAATGFPAERVNTRTLFAPTLKLPELVGCPQEFDLPQSPHRDLSWRTYGGASIDLDRHESELPELDHFDADRPLIYCSLGSQDHRRIKPFLARVLSMMAQHPQWQMIMAIGSKLRPEDFETVPSNVVLTQHAPQLAVLRRATIVITHGGLNTVKECIYFGVPMVVFPLWREQPGTAARVVYHSLGLHGSIRRTSARQLGELITLALNNPEYRQRCAAMQTSFLEAEEKQAGLRLIEELLSNVV